MKKDKIKALFPEEVETITISKNDYDRLYGNMTLENIELKEEIERLNNIINELEKYLEEELDRLVRETSHIYEDSLGKTKLVNEDIFEELSKIKNKLKELKGSNEPSFEEMVGFVENVYKDIKSQPTLHEELEEERKTIAKIVGDFKEVNK